MEKEKLTKIACKAIGFASSILLTIFAGAFGFASVATLVISAIDQDLISVIASGVWAFLAWVCWSIRRDVL